MYLIGFAALLYVLHHIGVPIKQILFWFCVVILVTIAGLFISSQIDDYREREFQKKYGVWENARNLALAEYKKKPEVVQCLAKEEEERKSVTNPYYIPTGCDLTDCCTSDFYSDYEKTHPKPVRE